MIPSRFMQKNIFRRCCIFCLLLTSLLCTETLQAQTDSLNTNAITRQTSPIVQCGIYPVMEIGLGAVGAGLGALVVGSLFVHSREGWERLIPALIGGSIGIVVGSAVVVHLICLKSGVNSTFRRTFWGSTFGLVSALACSDILAEENNLVYYILPATGATLFANLAGYKQNGQQAFVSPIIRIDTEKDYLGQTYSCVKVQFVAATF